MNFFLKAGFKKVSDNRIQFFPAQTVRSTDISQAYNDKCISFHLPLKAFLLISS